MAPTIQTLKEHQILLDNLVKRGFKNKRKDPMLGMSWGAPSPLPMLLNIGAVSSRFFGANIHHYTMYLFCGTVAFSCFSTSTTKGLLSLMGNADGLLKVNVSKCLDRGKQVAFGNMEDVLPRYEAFLNGKLG